MRYSDAEIGAVLRELREARRRNTTEVGEAAGLPLKLLQRAESGGVGLTGAQLSAVLDELGANFQTLHLRLTGSELEANRLQLMGTVARLMEEFEA